MSSQSSDTFFALLLVIYILTPVTTHCLYFRVQASPSDDSPRKATSCPQWSLSACTWRRKSLWRVNHVALIYDSMLNIHAIFSQDIPCHWLPEESIVSAGGEGGGGGESPTIVYWSTPWWRDPQYEGRSCYCKRMYLYCLFWTRGMCPD